MVFEMRLKSIKKKPNDVRCKSADSGVSVALSRAHKRDITKSSRTEINGIEEETLDFEFEDSENHSVLESEHIYSDQSTVKDFNLDSREDIDSNYPASESTTVEYSISNVSIAHRRDMLPLPRYDTEDRRQNQYLPLPSCYTPSVSARTRITLDSSSDDDSVGSETERNYDTDIQDHFTRDQSVRSGHAVEENSSPYSITQEEEDRLLDSSEDESHDDHNLVIQTDFVETCHIGNARITIPKFVSNSPKENQSNDLKRNNSTAKLKTFETKKKKKRWDLPFKPKNPFTYVFLDDIGYIDEDSEEDTVTSEGDSNLLQPQFGSLIVICNKDKIFCEEPRTTNQREIISLSKDEDNNFKLPLPPPKRPPTRPKRTVCNSEGSNTNLQIQFLNKGDDVSRKTSTFIAPKEYRGLTKSFGIEDDGVGDKDDTISILASSIGGDNVDDIANLEQLEDNYPLSPNESNYLETNDTPICVDDRVKEWVENVGNTDTLKDIPKRNINVIPSLSQINLSLNHPNLSLNQLNSNLNSIESQPNSKRNGIILMPPVSAKGSPRVNFKDVPNVFAGLCYHYYFSGNCVKPNCPLSHLVNVGKFVHKIVKRVDPKEIFKYFLFAMRFEKFFKEIYPSFVTAFGKLKMQNDLISCITYFLKIKEIDCVEAIDLVVKALQETGLSFQDAIEKISFNIGFFEHPVLADILLDLITRSYDISDNWEVIKRISKARGKINPSIVSRIFLSMVNVYPVNKELCREIYNMIVKNNMTDLTQIKEDVLIPVRTLIDFQEGTKSSTVTSIPDVQLRPLLIPNVQDLLSAHIDNKLIKEREFFEREVEGTTVRTKMDREPSYPVRNSNYESQKTTPYDNRSHSSGSDERYFQPTLRLSPFSSQDYALPVSVNNPYLRKEFSRPTPSLSSSPLESSNDIDIALRFEPPSEVSEYVPESIRSSKTSEPQEVKISLTPPRPIFGNPCYRSNFRLDKSIHNLLPDSFENVSINERDVAKLNSVIKSRDGVVFYELLQYYKDPPTLQNFITMTVVNLKSSTSSIYDTLISFIKSFGSINPDYAKDRVIKGIIEVIVMNCLIEIEKKGHWQQGRSLLELFCDWDSLVSSKIFSKKSITHMGRYIFLAKIFAKANDFHFTYEILQSPELKLLGPPESWPYFYNHLADLESRNTVLTEFFKSAHQHYIIGVADMYKRIYKYGGIYKFEAEIHFNPMLIVMINDQQTLLLKYFLPDIDIYYKVMDKNVLRAFTIMLAEQLNQDKLFRLYELCCERQIYTKYMGGETNITVRNNMFNIELQLILNYYFYKLSQTSQFPVNNVIIHIKLMDNKPLYPKMLQKCIRSIKEINNNLRKILKDHYSILTPETSSEQLTTIQIQHEQIKKWVQCNQRWFPIL